MNYLFLITAGLISMVLMGSWIIAWKRQWNLKGKERSNVLPIPAMLFPFLPLSMIIQRKVPQFKQPSEAVGRDLRALYPSQNPQELDENYMLGQIARMTALLIVLVLLIAWILPQYSGERQIRGELFRPSFQEGSQDTVLMAKSEEETVPIRITLDPQKPDQDEVMKVLIEARSRLQEDFYRMGEIHRSFQLPKAYGEVKIYYEDPDKMIDSSGYLHISSSIRTYRMIRIFAILEYQEQSVKTDLELVLNTIASETLQGQILKSIEENQSEEKITLPDSVIVNGKVKKVDYFEKGNQLSWLIFSLLVLLLPIVFLRLGKERLQEETKKRREKIHQSFPFAAEKLAVYLGAGMGLLEAWGRTAEEGTEDNPLIQEMRLTYHQMKNGIGIQEAMARFGNRTESTDLKKLAGILSRNIRRGDAYLLENMKNLNHEAWEQHRREVRTQLEKAQTKLLFPMLLMMTVVLILILTPAMITMMG